MLRFLSLAILGLSLSCAHAASVWFSDAQGLHRIDTGTNVVGPTIAQDGAVALALNQKDGSLWALLPGRLRRFDAAGALVVDVDLRTLATSFNAARRLALDPSDDSVWIAGGTHVAHLDANGGVLARLESPSVVQDIALAQDQSLWVLGRNEISRFAGQALAGRASLTPDLQQSAFLAIDDANGALWLAGGRMLAQLAVALPLQPRVTLALPEVVSGLALASETGAVWLAGTSTLLGFARDGLAIAATPYPRGVVNPQALAIEAASRSLWLGHERGISRFDAAGGYLTTLPAAVKAETISSAPSGIVPIVTLVSPPDGAVTTNAREPIRLRYDATCFGQPCNFPPSVFAGYALTATLNGQSIGSLFQLDPATQVATFVPATRHAEGANELQAFVTDAQGRRSRPIGARFTVDSIAPSFVEVTPADGSRFTSASITLQGRVDDPAARVTLESFGGATFSGPNPAGAAFSYLITLRPGANAFRLTATDPSGNSRSLSLAYVFSTLTLTIASPAPDAVIDDNKVTVAGTFTGAATATITVNGRPALVAGTAFTAADVPLVPGTNTLRVVGTTPEGARDEKTVTVTSIAPSITITSPLDGATVGTDRLFVAGRVQAPAGSGVTVNGAAAPVDAAGNFFAGAVALEIGANPVVATVTTPSGRSVSATVNVTSTGPAPIAILAEPLRGPAPLTVAFSLDNRAGFPVTGLQFAPGGPGTSAPTPPGALFAFTYPQPGIYRALVRVLDASGNAFDETIAVEVQDPAALDAMFRALWNGMNSALVAGDKARAMTFLSAGAKEKYGPVFDKLLPQMPAIVASYSALQRVSVSADIGEYAVNRTIDGVNRIFLIYFVRDANGVWLIDAM